MTDEVKPIDTVKEQPVTEPTAPVAEAHEETKVEAVPAKRFDVSVIKPGATVRVTQKIKEGEKERLQNFEGIVIAKRGATPHDATITVRKVSNGVGVERIFPLNLPTITNVTAVKQMKTRRAKLYHLRDTRARKVKEVVVSQTGPDGGIGIHTRLRA